MPPRLNSSVSYVKTTVPYPLFAADFDPYNRGYLVVGGGGGESKTGVPNQISVLDVSNRAVISTAAEINLSRDEDSVQSLGNLASKDGLITFAGINSSQADQNAGKNEHLRSFAVKYPPRKRQRTEDSKKSENDEQGEVNPLGKASLFRASTEAKKETYQRLLRLSPAQRRGLGTKRIGAVATGMAKNSEIVVFNATVVAPEQGDVITRIDLPETSEAVDLDVTEPTQSEFSIAYCSEHDIYEQTMKYDFSTKNAEMTPKRPRRVHQTPFPDTFQNPNSRPKFRSLRFLNPQNLITLANKPNKGGVELRIFHLYPTGPSMLLLEKTLPSRIKQAVSMDVCALDSDQDGNQQFLVAVAAQDISIEVYTTNYQRNTDTFSSLKRFIALRNVHEHQMTKICFSPFHSPPRVTDMEPSPPGPNGEPQPQTDRKSMHPGPQYVRLASVSYGNTVVVDTFPLSPLEPEDPRSRYVLSHPGDEAFAKYTYVVIISIVVIVIAFLIQAFRGGFSTNSDGGAFSLLPQAARDYLDAPAKAANRFSKRVESVQHTAVSVAEHSVPTNIPGKQRLSELVDTHLGSPIASEAPAKAAVVVHDHPEGSGLSMHVHPDREEYRKQDKDAKHWHELDEQQKTAWRAKLERAGEWVEGQGETVLMGVLFSEYAGMVGEIAREAMRG